MNKAKFQVNHTRERLEWKRERVRREGERERERERREREEREERGRERERERDRGREGERLGGSTSYPRSSLGPCFKWLGLVVRGQERGHDSPHSQ